MKNALLAAVAALAFYLPAVAQDETTQVALSPGQIVEAAAPEEWLAIAPEDLLVMTLAPDSDGNAREVVIQLIPEPFSQGWVDNVRLLTRSEWYDGIAVIRVQDNYVTQWGDPNADEENVKPLPEGLKVMGEDEYIASAETISEVVDANKAKLKRDKKGRYLPLFAERERRALISISSTKTAVAPQGWHQRDSYADFVELFYGWPIASTDTVDESVFFPLHCYGMVGVARGMSPNTGDGSSLYTVIGHAPRHLDRNIALVGRVIEGMEHLSSLPRGKGDLGFYEDPERKTPILSVRVASDLPADEQPAFQFLSTESETFARYAEARANRRDPFFIVPSGGADICNIPVPIRRTPE